MSIKYILSRGHFEWVGRATANKHYLRPAKISIYGNSLEIDDDLLTYDIVSRTLLVNIDSSRKVISCRDV